MNPIQHPLCNDVLRRPEGVPESECCDLHILRYPQGVASFWKPEEAELEAIKAGAPIMLAFVSHTHAPVSVSVLKPDGQPPAVKTDDVLQLAKDLVSHLNRVAKKHPETAKLTDRLLDLIKPKP